MCYKEVLVRYLILDFISIFLLLAVIVLTVFVIKKILPVEDSSNHMVRIILYTVLIIGSVFLFCIASSEIYHISIDMQDELYISANGSFTTDSDRMYFINENGDQVLLKIRPVIPDFESCDKATVIYSENSKILLDVVLN